MSRHRECIAALIACAGLIVPALAQDNPEPKKHTELPERSAQPRRDAEYKSESRRKATQTPMLIPSTRAEGVTVTGVDGERLGVVRDVIVRGDSGRIVYVLVTKGIPAGRAGDGAIRVAPVPYAAFAWDDQRQVLNIPVSEMQFKAAASFPADEWTMVREPGRAGIMYKYFNVPDDRATLDRKAYQFHKANDADAKTDHQAEGKEHAPATKDKQVLGTNEPPKSMLGEEAYLFRVSEIRNQPLLSKNGQEVGRLNDIVFDAPSGRVAFFVITPADSLQVGDGRIGVPWPSFEVDQTGRVWAMDVDRETLAAAPRLTQAEWAELRINGYTEDMYKRYGYDSSGWLGGGTVSAHSSTTWKDKYRNELKTGTARTVKGKIESVDDDATTDDAGYVVIKVKTDDGEAVTVHTAPKAYLADHNVALQKGDQVTVTGKSCTIDGKPCMVATEVSSADGKRVLLHPSQTDSR